MSDNPVDPSFDVWDMYFSGIVGWGLHPGYLKYEPDDDKMTLDDCADLADRMMKVREERRWEVKSCRG